MRALCRGIASLVVVPVALVSVGTAQVQGAAKAGIEYGDEPTH